MDGGQTGDETYYSLRELQFLTTCSLPLNGFEIYGHKAKIDYRRFIASPTLNNSKKRS